MTSLPEETNKDRDNNNNEDFNFTKKDVQIAVDVAELQRTIVTDAIQKVMKVSIDVMGGGKKVTNNKQEIDNVLHFYYAVIVEICTKLLASCSSIETNVLQTVLGEDAIAKIRTETEQYYDTAVEDNNSKKDSNKDINKNTGVG